MSLLENLNSILSELDIEIETGTFSNKAPDQYLVLVPIISNYELYADNKPQVDIEEIRISIYSKGNYLSLKKSIEKKLINGDITITDRRYNGYEKDTGYHHFTIDVAKDYEVEEE